MAEQLYINGTEPPERIPEIDEALDGWLDAKVEQKRAGVNTKLAHAVLVARVEGAGLDKYAYVDRTTGKRRFVYPDRTPKMKTTFAPRQRKDRDDEGRYEPDVGEEVTVDDKVEHRKVSRASVAAEVDADPFAATRGGLLEQAEKVQRGGATLSIVTDEGEKIPIAPVADGKKRKGKDKKRGKR